MTALADTRAPDPRLTAVLAVAAAALLGLALLWAPFETRLVGGDSAWVKPAKFAAAFVLTFATLALAQARLSPGWADGATLRITSWLMAAAFVGEMAYLFLQAARGEASHFNVSTPTAARLYQLMGVGAVTLVVGVAVFGLVVLLDRRAALGPALRLATGLGLVLGGLLTLVVAGWMSASGSHLVGMAPAGSARVPLMGWSLGAGDLRPAHFLALHAMQALPLWVLGREALGGRVGRAEVAGTAALWTALTLAAFAQALMGLPLVRL